jgi:hypothetical protein
LKIVVCPLFPPSRETGRRIDEIVALLADKVVPDRPLRQWIISPPVPLHYLFAARPHGGEQSASIFYRAISTHLIHKARLKPTHSATGEVALAHTSGSALKLNKRFHANTPTTEIL